MTRYTRKIALLAALSLVALLAVGAATASACGPGGGKGRGGPSASALVTAAATQLNITRAKLKTAIQDSANAYIDSEVTSGDLSSDDAADAKTQVEDDLGFAIATSRTKTVASNLGITLAALNDGFSAARKALAEAKIDKALKNGDITADQAAKAKDKLDDVDFPGYKAPGDAYGGHGSGPAAKASGSSSGSGSSGGTNARRGYHR
jgi:hypothetical protein